MVVAGRGLACVGWAMLLLMFVAAAGCGGGGADDSTDSADEPSHPTIRLLVVDDEELANAIRVEWNASGQGELELKEATSDEVLASDGLPADCVIFPSGLMGELAARRQIVPLPDEALASDSQLDIGDVFPLVRNQELAWGRKTIAVPFGSRPLVLMIRRDIFTHLDLSPPQTWEELSELARRLDDSADFADLVKSPDETWHSLALPLGKGSAGRTLLAWSAASASKDDSLDVLFDAQTMKPRIDSPPFVRALTQLVESSQFMLPGSLEMSPVDTADELSSHRCCMAVVWPRHMKNENQASLAEASFHELPGSRQVYDHAAEKWTEITDTRRATLLSTEGTFGAITAGARHTQAASHALVWLASPDNASRLAFAAETSLCRHSSKESADRFFSGASNAGVQMASVVEASYSQDRWLMMPRIPGRAEYMQALDEAVRKAVQGEQPPDQALSEAAAKWDAITDDHGREKQRAAYVRSLGMEP